jgi:predicted RNase H-like HicB family nuclease
VEQAGVLKYEIILYWSDLDQVVIAEVPELPGVHDAR